MYVFQFSLVSTQTPKTLRVASGFASQPWMLTVDTKLLITLLFLVKWISWYLSGANLTPCYFVYAIHLSCAWFNLVQFSTTVSPHIIRFVSSINPITTIF